MIAVAFLPPTPATVAVLKIIQAVQAPAGHGIQFSQILFAFGMGFSGVPGFDAAELSYSGSNRVSGPDPSKVWVTITAGINRLSVCSVQP